MILQAGETNSIIRHAIIAIGALNFDAWADVGHGMDGHRPVFAYHQYNMAITGLKKLAKEGYEETRIRVLACLLFSCFEAYHGNNDIVVAQTSTGLDMIAEYEASCCTNHSAPQQFPPLDREIVETFAMLEVPSNMYNTSSLRSREYHLQRMQNIPTVVENMPAKFENILEARTTLFLMLVRGQHWRFSQRDPENIFDSIPAANSLAPCIDDQRYFQLCKLLSDLRKWATAFQPLLRRGKNRNGKDISVLASILRLNYLSSYLWFATAIPDPQLYYRKYTREILEIVERARALMAPGSPFLAETFSFDTRIVLSLCVVGWYYRHRAARRDVIEFFSQYKRREGIWETEITGKTMQWLSEIEEAGLDDEDYVPEDAVASIVETKIDAISRTVQLTAVQQDRQRPGNTLLRQTVIHWWSRERLKTFRKKPAEQA